MRSGSLHVAFFNRAYYPESTATGQLLTELAEGLVHNHACRVTVVAGLPPKASGDQKTSFKKWRIVHREEHNGVEILRAAGTTFSKNKFWGRATNYVTYFFSACWAGLQVRQPDVTVALTDPPIIGIAAWLTAKKNGVPFVISFRDLFPEVSRLLEDFRSSWVDWFLIQNNRFQIRRAKQVIALGEAMQERLIQEKGARPDQVAIIPDWADTEQIRPGPKDNPFSKTHKLTNRFVVMHSGNMGITQNLEVLLDAANQLRDLENLQVIFIGQGVKKTALEDKAQQMNLTNVKFFPHQPKDQLIHTFATADCFVVSLKPGMAGYLTPSKLYGILAAGRPYVATVDETCDIARITRTYGCGLTAKAGDSSDLAEKIRQLHDDRNLAETLGKKAREASSHFDRTPGIKAYHTLLQKVVLG